MGYTCADQYVYPTLKDWISIIIIDSVLAPPHRLIQPDQYREYTLDEGIIVSDPKPLHFDGSLTVRTNICFSAWATCGMRRASTQSSTVNSQQSAQGHPSR